MQGINLLIEKYKESNNFETYIETICEFSKEFEIEIDEIVDIIDPILRKKIQIDFIERNYFPERKIEVTLSDFLEE